MSSLVIVDTDILIDAGRGLNDAVNYLEQIERRSPLAISIITQMELMVGCRNKAELRTLERFLRRFQLLKLDEPICDAAIDLLHHYRLSHGLLIPDALIAATAIWLNRHLLTKNKRDYRFIRKLDLLAYPQPFSSQ